MSDAALSISSLGSGKQALTRVTVELPLAIGRALDYVAPTEWAIAPQSCVEVTVGVRPHVGVVTAVAEIDADADTNAAAAKLKPVRRVLCAALPDSLVQLASFVADYYQVPLGMACGLISPMEAAPAPEVTSWRLTTTGLDHALLIDRKSVV